MYNLQYSKINNVTVYSIISYNKNSWIVMHITSYTSVNLCLNMLNIYINCQESVPSNKYFNKKKPKVHYHFSYILTLKTPEYHSFNITF